MKPSNRRDRRRIPTVFSSPCHTQQALDEKFAAIEEKDNEIHQLQLSLRERERDLDRLNNLLSHSEETINVSHSNFCFLSVKKPDDALLLVSNLSSTSSLSFLPEF